MMRALRGWVAVLFVAFGPAAMAAPGDLDTSFGVGGVATVDSSSPGAVVITKTLRQADGKIVVAGQVPGGNGQGFAIVGRFNADGSVDTDFASSGWRILTWTLSGNPQVGALAFGAGGKVLVGISDGGYLQMVRLNPDGSFDSSLCCSGPAQGWDVDTTMSNMSLGAIAELPDGRTAWAVSPTPGSYSFSHSSLLMRMPWGNPDYTFGNGGHANFALGPGFEFINAMLAVPSGFVVAGWNSQYQYADASYRDFAVARLDANGALDPTFGSSGVVTIDFNQGDDEVNALLVDEQSRLLAVGKAGWYAGYAYPTGFAAARMSLATGALDPTFGIAGKTLVSVADPGYESSYAASAQAIDILGNGDLLLSGARAYSAYPNPYSRLAFARLDANAQSTIVSFGTNGIALGPDGAAGSIESLAGVVVDPVAGTILGIGTRHSIVFPQTDTYYALTERFALANGSLDPTYGQGGSLTAQPIAPREDVAVDGVVQPDGKIVAVGTSGNTSTVTRLMPDGTLDASFANGGRLELPYLSTQSDGQSILLQPDGKIVVASNVWNDNGGRWGFSRLNPDGTLDSSWSPYGALRVNIPAVADPGTMALQADGRIVVGSFLFSTNQMLVARVSPGGLDTSFNGSGYVALPLSGTTGDAVYAVAVQDDGKILAAGYANNGGTSGTNRLKVARLTSTGALDSSWGTGGAALMDYLQGIWATSLLVQPDGKVLVGAQCRYDWLNTQTCVARLLSNGTPDGSFGNNGIAVLGFGSGVYAMTFEGSGKILVGRQGSVLRMNPDGSLDSSYAQGSIPASAQFWNAVAGIGGEMAMVGYTSSGATGDVVAARFQGDGDLTPDPFTFVDRSAVGINQYVVSAPVAINGFSGIAAPISVANGEYSIGCSGVFTSAPGVIASGRNVCVRHLSASTVNVTTNTVLTVGGVSDTFSSTTASPPTTTLTSAPPHDSNSTTANFTFVASDPAATFQCKLGSFVDFTPCTSPVTMTGLAEGPHHFEVRATNAVGTEAAGPVVDWYVDVTPPDTAITAGPSGPFNLPAATFTFGGYEGGLTFECRIDGGVWSVCASPYTTPNLADGSHVFDVRAKDAAGNVDPTPATGSWSTDTVAPDTTIASGPSGTIATSSFTFTWASDDPAATFECRSPAGTGNWLLCANPASFSNIPDGTYTIEVRAKDAAGNVDATPPSRTFTIDTTPPDTTITSGPTGSTSSTSATFLFTSNETGAAFECRLDGAAFGACSSPVVLSGLAQGTHTFDVRAIDAAGNVDATPASRTWGVDTVPPDTTITSGPVDAVSSSSATFTFTATEAGTFECRLDGGAFAPCTSPASYSGLSDGSHTFDVRGTDAAGNVDATPASRTWTVDTIAPDTTITSGPTGSVASTSATIAFSSNEAGAAFECRVDGAAFVACTSPTTLSGLGQGAHTFDVRARDAAANVDQTPASATWTVDTIAPDTTVTMGPSGAVASTSATIAFGASEGATFQCNLDGGAFASCASPVTLTNLPQGGHMFQVRAIDTAGNVDATPAAVTWTVDTVAETTITSGPTGSVASTSASFSFTAGEPATFQCSFDGSAFAACTSPYSRSGLTQGSHTFQVSATDTLGNTDASPAVATWIVDTVAPTTTITSKPANNTPVPATFAFSSNESGATFECHVDSAPFAPCSNPITYTSLAVGAHTFTVRARDAAGNVDASPASYSWHVK